MLMTAWLMLSTMLCSLQLSTGSFPKPLTEEEERRYLSLAAQGDENARNILIERNLRLVAHIMKKYYALDSDQEDLVSIGTIGLIKGITTFDQSKGARLATYAARCVENEILMHFRSMRKSAQDVSLSDYIETGADGSSLSLMDVVSEETDLLEQISDRPDPQLEPARLAPSAVNSQPWYFTHEGDTLHIHCSKKGSRLDAGIALAHLFVANRDTFRFFQAEKAAEVPGCAYIGSFAV